MTYEGLDKYLIENSTDKKKVFDEKLMPGSLKHIGVKIPVLRKLAKEIAKGDWVSFVREHHEEFFEHQTLKAFVIGYAKDDIRVILEVADEFLPSISDWAVNDAFCQNFSIAKRQQEKVWKWLDGLIEGKEFNQRVVAVMCLSHYLNDEYIDRVFAWMNKLKYDGYYTKMGVAWCVATAYAKYPEKGMAYLKNNELDDWTYNKSIQKMIESYRITDEDKKILRTMKRKKEQ